MFRNKLYMIVSAAALFATALHAQGPVVEPRIAGLENNEEYMLLLREDAQLQIREDSIAEVVAQTRRLLRSNPEGRQALSQEILRLEGEIFELRSTKGRLIDRIGTIEQEWVLSNLNAPDAVAEEEGSVTIPDSLKLRNLIDNSYFRDNLPQEDYGALRRAQRMELPTEEYVTRYLANYTSAREFAEAYAGAQSQSEALDYEARYKELQAQNLCLADSIVHDWNYIFDNKSYAYAYLLEGMQQESILAREEEALSEVARELTTLRETTSADVVADYLLRKRVILSYETALAELLALDAARDSLASVKSRLAGIDYHLPPLAIEERTFIEYDSVAFSSTSKYTYQNPIPECKVYPRGVIYRLLLGTFNTKRAASTFRGAYPLYYQINEAGKWCYYTGGFATQAEAESMVKVLKKQGFVRPEVVVWRDGVYRNLTQNPEEELPQNRFRVEISGCDVLPDRVKEVVAASAEGYELSRVGQQLFVIGVFDDRAVAERLSEALQQADSALGIKIVEVTVE